MIILFGAIFGIATGAFIARRRKGHLADILQYAFVYGAIFAVSGLFASILIQRLFG